MYQYELHAHTSECDRDAFLSARELVHLYKDAGYDGMVITDHYIERYYHGAQDPDAGGAVGCSSQRQLQIDRKVC